MEEFISILRTPDECDQAARLFADLAQKARIRSVELRAKDKESKSGVEFELHKVLFAYEAALSEKNKRKTRANRTWQMVNRYGIVKPAEKAVDRETDAMGYRVLADLGMKDLTFEAVILKYPKYFSHDAVVKAKSRLEELEKHYASRYNEK